MDGSADYGEFPLRTFLGMQMVEEGDGRARARLEVGEHHLNPNGVVHGAVLFTLVDTAMGMAAMSVVASGTYTTSVEVQLRFIRPVASGELVADVEVLKAGRHVIHLEGRIVDGEQRLIATATGTFTTLSPDR